MIHFHSLKVQRVNRETEDCVSISFEVPQELKEVFRFRQGQSLTVRKILDGEELRRTYSICCSPLEDCLQVAVKKVEGGLFSTWVNEQLKAGDYLEVMSPVGKFYTELNAGQKKNYMAFAAGSGITPVLSIIKTTLAVEQQSRFTLVYGNRTKNSIIFKEELEALKDKYIDRFSLIHVLSREKTETELNSGRIDVNKLELLFSKLLNIKSVNEFFLCGPEEMIFCIKGYLAQRGISADHIHFELFTIPGEKKSTVETAQEVVEHPQEKAKVTVKLDGILFEFDLPYEGQSILDAALDKGADLPYACKGGVCTTCKAKLMEGKVEMDVNWGLEDAEVEEGYILTCQSHPVTPEVFVDFDNR